MAIANQDIPPVKVVALTSQRPKRGRPRRIEGSADIRWPVVQEFLRSSSLSANSQRLYERELRRFLGWTHLAWADLKLRHVGQYKAYLLELEVKPGKTMSPSSVNAALTALKSFFRWLSEAHPELCPVNPTAGLRFEKLSVPMAQDIPEEQMALVWAAVEERGETRLRDRALLQLLAHGMRAGEVVATNIGSFNGQVITVENSKNKQPRLVPLNVDGQNAVVEYLDWRREDNEELTIDAPLVVSQHRGWGGQRLSYHGVYQVVEAIGVLAGVEDLHPHRLRHTGAAGMLRQGIDPAHAMRLTGHTDSRSFRRYTLGAEQEAAVAAFYREQEPSKKLVFAKGLSRKQRRLLLSLANLTGKEPLGQAAFEEGAISFGELWQENVQEMERRLELAKELPGIYGVDTNPSTALSSNSG